MTDDDPEFVIATVGEVHPDMAPRDGYATVRCSHCGREGQIATHKLPIELNPIRGDDGTRLGLCPDCQPKLNRAERRRKGR